MTIYIVYVHCAYLWALCCKSFAFPALLLACFNALYFHICRPSEEYCSLHDNSLLHKDLSQNQYEYNTYFILFALVGALMAQNIRYPPLIDILYLREQPIYFFKCALGLLVAHASCVSLVIVKDTAYACAGYVCAMLGWSYCFLHLLSMDEVKWQNYKSIRSFIFFLNAFIAPFALVHVIGIDVYAGVYRHTIALSSALFTAFVAIFVYSTVNRGKSASSLMQVYAREVYWACMKRSWMLFYFDDTEDSQCDAHIDTLEQGRAQNSPAKRTLTKCRTTKYERNQSLPPPPHRRAHQETRAIAPSMSAGTTGAPPGMRPYDLHKNEVYRQREQNDTRAKRIINNNQAKCANRLSTKLASETEFTDDEHATNRANTSAAMHPSMPPRKENADNIVKPVSKTQNYSNAEKKCNSIASSSVKDTNTAKSTVNLAPNQVRKKHSVEESEASESIRFV